MNSGNKTLTEGPLTPQIIRFILPLMATGILQLLYNAADSIVVGRWESTNALAAVTSVGSLINLLVNLVMGLSVGTSVAVAHDYGAKDYEGVSRTVHTSYLVSFLGGVFVSAVGMIFSRQFLIWMKSDPAVLPLSWVPPRTWLTISARPCSVPSGIRAARSISSRFPASRTSF